MIKHQRRGTAIVETSKGILVVSGKSKRFLLPGGRANKNEPRLVAVTRELREETGLMAKSVKYLFSYKGQIHKGHNGCYFRDYHKVFLIKATGRARPRSEVKHVAWYARESEVMLSKSARDIIDKYLNGKY